MVSLATFWHKLPINSFEALSFKMLSEEVRKEANSLFLNNLIPSQACNKFLQNLKKDYENNLNFHLQKFDRSKCPRRRDFNSLYITVKNILDGKMAKKCVVTLKEE